MYAKDRERVLVEVIQRVLDRAAADPTRLEKSLFDTLYEERRRLEVASPGKLASEQGAFYARIQSEALHADPGRQRELLREIVASFAHEVVGKFDPRVYAVATRAIPPALTVLLNASSPMKLASAVSHGISDLGDRLKITGEVDALKKLASLGTVVLVPTHASHLDSILVGYALYLLGLPPFLYGAGLNLFSNKLMGFFMQNLGAYKVDRKKKAEVYKDVLKTYAGCTMEAGYHNLFFPGGTRSRSGAVEQKLKLGLLGMGLDAYVHNLLSKHAHPDVFVVPCTINYELVLEAETLIDDYLKEAGKSRYIIEDDEFSRPRKVLDFVAKLFSLDSRIDVVVCPALDVFGNSVDAQGISRDGRDRPIERTRYVLKDGAPCFDRQRDDEYTRELALAIVASFQRHTVVKSTHLVCKTVFDWLRENSPGVDLYRLLRTGGPEESLPLVETYQAVERTLGKVRSLRSAGRILLDETLSGSDAVAVVSNALKHLGSYHRRAALVRKGDRLFHQDRNLVYYYQNRLAGLGANAGVWA